MKATCDQCQYGCEAEDVPPMKKLASFMTNAPALARDFTVRCNGRNGGCSQPADLRVAVIDSAGGELQDWLPCTTSSCAEPYL